MNYELTKIAEKDKLISDLISFVSDKKKHRNDVVGPYADLIILFHGHGHLFEEEEFMNVNYPIIERWSLSALEYIKNKAWKLAAEKAIEKIKD